MKDASKMWQSKENPAHELRKIFPSTDPIERAAELEKEADALEEKAERLEGTYWTGDISPSMARRLKAAEKREHAALLRKSSI